MICNKWKQKLQQDFTGDNDAGIRMLQNSIVDSQMWPDGDELRLAALRLIAVLQN